MKNFQNKKFIYTKISSILFDCIEKINNASSSINFYPANEMFLQTVFLKLTGAQEQKFKSMLWEWGCIDLDYRKHLLKYCNYNNQNNYPEPKNYSVYCEKKDFIEKMYNAIFKEINIDKCYFLCDDNGVRLNDKFIASSKDDMTNSFIKTNSFYSKINLFKNYWNDNSGFVNNTELELIVKQVLKEKNKKELLIFTDKFVNNCYEKLYNFRNKCAHNMFVYQNAYPSLKELSNMNENDNVFKWIQTLLIIDELSMYLFDKLESI